MVLYGETMVAATIAYFSDTPIVSQWCEQMHTAKQWNTVIQYHQHWVTFVTNGPETAPESYNGTTGTATLPSSGENWSLQNCIIQVFEYGFRQRIGTDLYSHLWALKSALIVNCFYYESGTILYMNIPICTYIKCVYNIYVNISLELNICTVWL